MTVTFASTTTYTYNDGSTNSLVPQSGTEPLFSGPFTAQLSGTVTTTAGSGFEPAPGSVISAHITGGYENISGQVVQLNETINVQLTGWTDATDGSGDPTYYFVGEVSSTEAVSFQVSLDPAGANTGPAQNTTGSPPPSSTCFLVGTRILTPEGERLVETLCAGDLATTLVSGTEVTKTIKWVGYRSVKVRQLAPDEAYPVRIRANAFGDDLPHRDLLVTPEHCIFVNGRLIPTRMLVNHRSIVVDRSIASYTYYHVELERHGILVAEGLPAESYLDTGNRRNFANDAAPALRPDLAVHAEHASWSTDAAAPLAVTREEVEPVWQALEQRALDMGLASGATSPVLSADPALRLVVDGGVEIKPKHLGKDQFSFKVPAGTRSLRLRSRCSRPADVVGPFVDDRRHLGVRIGAILVTSSAEAFVATDHLTRVALAGWHAPEDDGTSRWTDGNALLPISLPVDERNRPVFLQLEIVAAGPYVADETVAHEVEPELLALAG